MNKALLCIGYIGANGENYLNPKNELDIEPEILAYFYQKYKEKPGVALFFNRSGGLVVKPVRDLSIEQARYFGLF